MLPMLFYKASRAIIQVKPSSDSNVQLIYSDALTFLPPRSEASSRALDDSALTSSASARGWCGSPRDSSGPCPAPGRLDPGSPGMGLPRVVAPGWRL